MSAYQLTYQAYGAGAVLVGWPAKIAPEILDDIRCFTSFLKEASVPGILEWNSSYCSVLIVFNPMKTNYQALITLLKTYRSVSQDSSEIVPPPCWEIPVCYEPPYAIDLPDVAKEIGMDIQSLISLHTGTEYRVYGIGFLPGFLYLGGLPPALHLLRKTMPTAVPKGAVAIGGQQTGVYPKDAPGGWHVIGQTPLPLFNSKESPPCQVAVGDAVRFREIDSQQYKTLHKQVEQGAYPLKKYGQ